MADTDNRVGGAGLKLALALIIVLLAMPTLSLAQRTTRLAKVATAAPTFEVRHTATFSVDELIFGELLSYDAVRLAEGDYLIEPGKPMLPARIVRIALPAGMAVTRVRLVDTEAQDLTGKYTIFPAQPPKPFSDPLKEDDFVSPDPRTYASTAAYPSKLVKFTYQTDLAGQAVAVVQLYPLQYVPAHGRLTLHTSITFVLEGADGYACGDYLPGRISASGRDAYERMVTDMVVNADEVQLQALENPPPQTFGVGPGDYDYVIVTQSDWTDDFQPLADWKTKRGIPATIVDRDWIYSEYSGSTNAEKIRAFVIDAHANWGTLYFLLGGDTNVMPYHTRTILGEDIPNDTYYSDYDSDWTCEVHVGRAGVRRDTGVATFINKVFTYEKNPPLTNYAKTAFFCGFDATARGSAEGESCKEAIRSRFLPIDWTLRTEYDSEAGTHRTDVIAYLNQGSNLVNHIDHSDTTVMGVGSINHNDFLYTSNMSSLSNGDRQSILYSVGCFACNYPYNGCIGEVFIRNSGGGGIAFVGNSRNGWYVPYSDDGLSQRYDRRFYRSLFNQDHYFLGECFSDHKNDSYQNDAYYRYIFTELTLLGDPGLPIWTEDPQSLTVMHDETLLVGEFTTFPVEVRSGGSPLESATVCLWKAGDVYEVEQADASGIATFWFAPSTLGTMYVTVSHRNYLPNEGDAEVVESGEETILPDDYTIVRGQHVSGGLTDLFYSDDSYLLLWPNVFLTPTEPPVWVIVEGTATMASPTQLRFTLEAYATTSALVQKIELFNYVTQSYEEVDSRNTTLSDSVVEVVVAGDPSRFIEPGTLAMKAQLTWRFGPVGIYAFDVGIDQTIWMLTP